MFRLNASSLSSASLRNRKSYSTATVIEVSEINWHSGEDEVFIESRPFSRKRVGVFLRFLPGEQLTITSTGCRCRGCNRSPRANKENHSDVRVVVILSYSSCPSRKAVASYLVTPPTKFPLTYLSRIKALLERRPETRKANDRPPTTDRRADRRPSATIAFG